MHRTIGLYIVAVVFAIAVVSAGGIAAVGAGLGIAVAKARKKD